MRVAGYFLFACMTVLMLSCKNDSEDLVSEVGKWNITDVKYYYDGKLLDYKEFVIDVWPTSHRAERFGFVSQGGFILNDDGTGKAFGNGEFWTDEYDLTYTKEGRTVRISISSKGRQVTSELKLDNKNLKNSIIESDIYGWAPDDSEEVYGADGNGTHTLEIVQIYTKQK